MFSPSPNPHKFLPTLATQLNVWNISLFNFKILPLALRMASQFIMVERVGSDTVIEMNVGDLACFLFLSFIQSGTPWDSETQLPGESSILSKVCLKIP